MHLTEYDVEITLVDGSAFDLEGAASVEALGHSSSVLEIRYPDDRGNEYAGWHVHLSPSAWRELRFRPKPV